MMLFGSYPRLLVLALSLPEVSHALGLGNMRVQSALNEPLSAQIDIIGATAEELTNIRASVASAETFDHYRAERPAFLSSATISVGADAAGKPVLNIQSREPFTEPLVELLLDVRSGHQQLVRDYTLLLDPVPLAAAQRSSAASELPAPPDTAPTDSALALAAPALAAIAAASAGTIDAAQASRASQYRVVINDTLSAIVQRAGAGSQAEQQRLMLAIFRANPHAFGGTINLLHSGALINIPASTEVQFLDSRDVAREIGAQLTFRGSPGPTPKSASGGPPAIARPEPVSVVGAASTRGRDLAQSTMPPAANELEDEFQSLQRNLKEANRQLADVNVRLASAERAAQGVPAAPKASERRAQPQPRKVSMNAMSKVSMNAMMAGLLLLMGALTFALRRFLASRSPQPAAVAADEPTAEAPVIQDFSLNHSSPPAERSESYSVTESVPVTPTAAAGRPTPRAGSADGKGTVQMSEVVEIDVDSIEEGVYGGEDGSDTVLLINLDAEADMPTGTLLDYNLADLDGRAQHVEMTGTLHGQGAVVDRRKNIVDTLMAALKRDPTRTDLRMKLLETLYAAAATNLRVFKEVVRDLADHPERLEAGEWEQIMSMGRQIAPGDALFAERPEDDKIADCA